MTDILPTGSDKYEQRQPSCALCGQPLSDDERGFCVANTQRFNGQIFCREHQKRFSVCPAMRWQPGGRGLLR